MKKNDPSTMQFAKELSALIRRTRQESDLSYSSAIGVLEMIKAGLLKEAFDLYEQRGEQGFSNNGGD